MIENKEIKKRKYEISFVLKTENISVISQSLTNGGFVILTENPLEKVQLAYPIKKENYAYFGYCHFEGEPAAVKNLRVDLKLNPEVLRYLIVTPPFIKKPAWRRAEPTESPKETKPNLPADRQSLPADRQALPTGRQVMPAEPILTNEALEKKIEEILG